MMVAITTPSGDGSDLAPDGLFRERVPHIITIACGIRTMRFLLSGLVSGMICLGMLSPASAGERFLQVVSPRDITSLEPNDTGYHFRRLRVAETLVTIDPSGKLEGQLATSWQVESDNLTWRFALRQGVRFHDGSLATPEVILNQIKRAYATSEVFSTAPVGTISLDGNTLVLKLTRPCSLLPAFLTDATTIILAPSSFGADGKVRRIVGTGPYEIVGGDGKSSLDLQAFHDYWGPKPAIGRVHYLGVRVADTMANMAEAGQADLVFMMPRAMKDRVESSGRATVTEVQTPRVLGFFLNVADYRFNDLRVRRAISLALDRQGTATAVFRNPMAAANQLISPAFPAWHDSDLPVSRQDVPGARALLAQAGWRRGHDGILVKDGKRFSFTVIVGPAPELAPFAQTVQAALREVGIEMTLEAGPLSAVLDSVKSGTFVAGLTRRTYGMVPDPVGTLLADYAPDKANNDIWGGVGFKNAMLSSAFAAYLEATDEHELADARKKINRIVNDQLPIIPVVWYDYGVSISTKIDPRSVVVDPFEFSFWLDKIRWAP